MPTAQEVYAAAVRPLAPAERLRLAALILDELTQTVSPVDESETWSEEDLRDLTVFSLRHAETHFSTLYIQT